MSYEASAALRDITPPQEWIDGGLIWLWGYGDRSGPCSGVADPLDARAVCIRDDDGGTAVLITADVGALDPATTEQVRARLEASHGLARSQVCLNVSHTHSAPVAVLLRYQKRLPSGSHCGCTSSPETRSDVFQVSNCSARE